MRKAHNEATTQALNLQRAKFGGDTVRIGNALLTMFKGGTSTPDAKYLNNNINNNS